MAEVCYGSERFLVLHFMDGKLQSMKACRTWRGVQMSKANHLRLSEHMPALRDRVHVKVLPLDAILAMKGLEAPSNELSPGDAEILKSMGIVL